MDVLDELAVVCFYIGPFLMLLTLGGWVWDKIMDRFPKLEAWIFRKLGVPEDYDDD